MSGAQIGKLFADQNKLRLAQQGMKTQHGYTRRHVAHLELSARDTRRRVRRLEFTAFCIAEFITLFLATYIIGLHMR